MMSVSPSSAVDFPSHQRRHSAGQLDASGCSKCSVPIATQQIKPVAGSGCRHQVPVTISVEVARAEKVCRLRQFESERSGEERRVRIFACHSSSRGVCAVWKIESTLPRCNVTKPLLVALYPLIRSGIPSSSKSAEASASAVAWSWSQPWLFVPYSLGNKELRQINSDPLGVSEK